MLSDFFSKDNKGPFMKTRIKVLTLSSTLSFVVKKFNNLLIGK